MNMPQEQHGRNWPEANPKKEDDDEVGKPLWKIPEGGEAEQESEDEEEEDIRPEIIVPVTDQEQPGIWAPEFDPEQQRDWEERERRRREEEAEREQRENPRGVWEMKDQDQD